MKLIEYFMLNPVDAQNKIFYSILQAGKNTAFGKDFKLNEINNICSFKERIPVSEYHDIFPYIQRMRNGEKNVLWNTPINLFAKSSGTTSQISKFIPVSNESIHSCHFKAGRDMYTLYCNAYPDSDIFKGSALGMGGHLKKNRQFGFCEGDLSALLMKKLPYFAQRKREPSLNTALMSEWESKINRLAETTTPRRITHLLGVPSWTLLLLRQIIKKNEKKNISEVWPHLEVFFHGGVNFEPYIKEYHNIMGSNMRYFQTYNASEGYFAIQDLRNAQDMLLLLNHGIFFEFLPLTQNKTDKNKLLSLSEIELNTSYALVITTNSGLWRYLIGDTVVFTSKDPYRIKITGRTRYFINAVGEELILENVENALQQVLPLCDAIIEEYSGCPKYSTSKSKAHHEWIFEFSKVPNDIQKFTEMFDLALQNVNSDYAAKRYQNMLLDMPVIHVAPKGTFYEWMRRRGKLGGQHKVPRLANDRIYLDEIIPLMNNML